MAPSADRRAELVAAALSGELTSAERDELEAACAADPTLRRELDELGEVTGRLSAARLAWIEEPPPPALEHRVLAAVSGARDRSPLRRRAVLATAAAACVAVGAVGALVVQNARLAPPTGPPGTLGAVEEIAFVGAPRGSDIDAALVAHTWGTETLLQVDGLRLGETFEVLLVGADGREFSSGTFFATEQTVVCRMNAAILREDVTQVRIDAVDGSMRAVADLVAVGG
jgi:hypothetical protein